MEVKHTYTSKGSPGAHWSDAGAWETCTGISAWFEKLPCFSQSTHCPVLLQPAAAERQQETRGSISWPEPCQLQQMALGCRGMAGKLGVCSSPPHSLSVGNLWERAEGWLPGVCWFSRFHPSFVCGMNPYLIRKHTSGWHNAKQRSAVRAREWDPKQEDIKHPSCPLPCKKGKCCVTGLSKKNKELDILFKGNQNLELAKQ